MHKKLTKLFLILLLSVGLIAASFAQVITGSIRGTITDDEGNPLPGISVTVSSPAMMGDKTFITSATGSFRFLALPVGHYTLKAELAGFKTITRSEIIVRVGMAFTANIQMATTGLEEEITVREDPLIEYKAELRVEAEKEIEEEIEQLSIGQIVFNPSEEMTEHIRERIEVRISQNIIEDLTQGLKGRGIPQVEEIKVSTVMAAKLTGDTFKIIPLSDEEQPILSSGYAQWEWDVTPQKAGHRKLQLSVSASIYVDRFGEKKKSAPVKEKVINVKVNPNIKKPRKIDWYKIMGGIGAFVGTIAALFGIYLGFKQLKLAYKRRKE